MGGALKSVFGGSGGIFGAVLGVASMFFPPLAVAGSLSNMLTSAIGEAVKMAASTLVKELGMPKFIQGIINNIVDQALPQLQHQSSPDVDNFVQNQAAPFINQFRDDYAAQVVQRVKEKMAEGEEGAQGAGGKGKASLSGKSWFVKLAIAMGEALNKQADKVESLANQVNDSFGAKAAAQKAVNPKNGAGLDKVTEAEGKNFQLLQELQGETKVLDMLSQTVNNAVNTIGTALSSAARKG